MEEMRKKYPARVVNDWLAYSQAIGGLTPLSAEIVVFAIWRLAESLGCRLRFDEIFLPQVGRDQTTLEATAALEKWDSHTRRVKPKITFGERIR